MPHDVAEVRYLGELEMAVMEVMWARPTATVREVRTHLHRTPPPGYTTVATIMTRLVDKGLRFWMGKPVPDVDDVVQSKRFNLFLHGYGADRPAGSDEVDPYLLGPPALLAAHGGESGGSREQPSPRAALWSGLQSADASLVRRGRPTHH